LLLTDFVTELRAAIHNAADGRRLADDPVYMRAQLALLLREVGLTQEAKAEGESVITALRGRPMPTMDKHDARFHLRAYARASEAIGDDRGATQWYDHFINFGSQVANNKDCRGCHRDAGPTDLAWFRDWWAGERYADLRSRLGEMKQALSEQETALREDPSNVATRLKLAYLLEKSGNRTRAAALWSDMKHLAQTGELGVKYSRLAQVSSP
jgi:tetratricopeptide (TPR) repeat protein